MKKTTLTLLSLLLLTALTPVFGQQAQLQKAEQHMEALRYAEAAALFEKLLRKDENFLPAVVGMANAQRKAHKLADAVVWYRRAVQLPDAPPYAHYNLGQLLLQFGDCLGAQEAFDQYLRLKPYDTRKDLLGNVCAWQELVQTPSGQYTVSLPDFNGANSDLAPAFYQDGIVFGAVRSRSDRKAAFYDLYFTKPMAEAQPSGIELTYAPVEPFAALPNTNMNEAIISFSPDFKEAYFTRNQLEPVSDKSPLHRLEILMAQQDNSGNWSAPKALPFNSRNYNTAHPSLSADGAMLFFASDRPGGFGGKDIYVSQRSGSTWSAPINLGPNVNTEGDELYPHYHANGNLYFASNGHLGLGGLDVFRTANLGKEGWSPAENMGMPVNSAADDFGLILYPTGEYGFFTSNRDGGTGNDDIYAFQTSKVQLDLAFLNEDASEAVTFTVRGSNDTLTTDSLGKWTTWLGYNECLHVQVLQDGKVIQEREICASASTDSIPMHVDIPLVPNETTLVAKGGSGAPRLIEGWVADELSGEPLAGALVYMLSSECATTIRTTTDEEGRFSFTPQTGCCYTVKITNENYFSNAYTQTICTEDAKLEKDKIYYLSPFQSKTTSTPDKKLVNVSTPSSFKVSSSKYHEADMSVPYLLNVYYDLGRSSVRTDALGDLSRLYWMLVNNPDVVVEICSHTDARGSNDYNKRLSQRRADAIVNWLIQKGIEHKRLQARGYGEERPVNECKDGVACSEEAYQVNRRTEFRILNQSIGQAH